MNPDEQDNNDNDFSRKLGSLAWRKQFRCTKRVHPNANPPDATSDSLSSCLDDSELLYTNTVSRMWNNRHVAMDKALLDHNQKKCHSSTNQNITGDREEDASEIKGPGNTDSPSGCDNNESTESRVKRRRSARLSARDQKSNDEVEVGDGKIAELSAGTGTGEPSPPATAECGNKRTKRTRVTKSAQTSIKRLKRMKRKLKKTPVVSLIDDDDDDCVEVFEHSVPSVAEKIRLKISCLNFGIQKFEILLTGLFSDVVKFMAGVAGVKPDLISLYLNDKKIEEYETPKSIGVSVADIIECYVRSTNKSDSSESLSNKQNPNNSIQIFVQIGDKNRTAYRVNKDEPIGKLMKEFSRSQEVDLSSVTFRFDGEIIDPLSTARALELENGFCIDAVICTTLD